MDFVFYENLRFQQLTSAKTKLTMCKISHKKIQRKTQTKIGFPSEIGSLV